MQRDDSLTVATRPCGECGVLAVVTLPHPRGSGAKEGSRVCTDCYLDFSPVRKFYSLPLGARFSYQEFPDEIWVILEKHGTGLIAKWDGIGSGERQSLCSVAETEEGVKMLDVIVREGVRHA